MTPYYYSDLTTLKNYLPRETLQQLTDDNGTDQIDPEKINFALRQSTDFIDMYLQGRYALPLKPVTDGIRDLCTKLAVYFLYRRTLALTLPEPIKIDYKESISTLEKIQSGKITLMPEAQNPEFYASSDDQHDVNNIVASALNTSTNNWANYYI